MMRKVKDWQGWLDGMRSKAFKAGAESIATNLTAVLGTNGIASMLPTLNDYTLSWKEAIFTTSFQFIVRVVLAGAQYVAAKPDPDIIVQNVDTSTITK